MHHRAAADRRPGVTAVELAFLLPLLCFLFVVAVDFSRAFYFSIIVTNCARNGATYGSQDPTCALDTTGIKTAAQRDASNLTLSSLNVASTTDSSSSPTSVTVTVTYPFSTITNYPGVGGTWTISRVVKMSVAPWTPN